jgi:hypothetical protein
MRLTSAAVRWLWLPVGLFVLAFAVRLLAAEGAAYGDELATLREAQNLGFNLNGIGFLILYNPWVSLSTDLLWLRLLPICFGSLSVVLCYLWLRAWRPLAVAIIASGLLAISPIAVEYGQQIRFYSFFLFSVMLFFWLYALYTQALPAQRAMRAVGLIGAALLVLSAQMLGVLVVAAVCLHWLAGKSPKRFRVAAFACIGVLFGIALLAISSPDLLQVPYSAASRIFDGNANFEGRAFNYSGPRGWSPIIGVKLIFLGYHAVFGQYTYPLDWLIVLPAILIFAAVALLGLWQLHKRNRSALHFVLLSFFFAMLVYIVLDPLLPAQITASANVRLVIWIVPIILWLVAEGLYTVKWRSLQGAALIAVIGVQGYGLLNMVTAAWEKPDHAAVVRALAPFAAQPNTVILADGRSHGFLAFNLRQPPNLELAWAYIGKPDFVETLRERGVQRLVMVSADFQEANRCQFSALLNQLSGTRLEQGIVDYPFFAYTFDLATHQGAVISPVSAYHMRYQDAKLPQPVAWAAYDGQVVGAYTLPDCQGQRRWQSIVDEQNVKQVLILSNIVTNSLLQIGTEVATLTLITSKGERIAVPLLYGQHTQRWDAAYACSSCESVFQWRKRAALVGSAAYEGAYRDFTAHIWGTTVELCRLSASSLKCCTTL